MECGMAPERVVEVALPLLHHESNVYVDKVSTTTRETLLADDILR